MFENISETDVLQFLFLMIFMNVYIWSQGIFIYLILNSNPVESNQYFFNSNYEVYLSIERNTIL